MSDKCCIAGCSSSKPEVRLHAFPRSDKRFQMWLKCIKDLALYKLKKNVVVLRRRVCCKHFEAKFIREKSAGGAHFILTSDAYPTLFNKYEIESGVPTKSDFSDISRVPDHLHDHIYCLDSTLAMSTHTQETLLVESNINSSEKDTEASLGLISNKLSDSETETQLHPGTTLKGYEDRKSSETNLQTDLHDVWLSEETYSTNNKSKDKSNSDDLGLFSWQMKSHVPCLQVNDDPVCLGGSDEDHSLPATDFDDDLNEIQDIDANQDYTCNACYSAIGSDRFACAQCVDYDLCAQCAGERAAHRQHYLLRVPPRRPPAEVELVLHKLRELLNSVNVPVILTNDTDKTEVKTEVKDEEEVIEDPLNVEETTATVPDVDGDSAAARRRDTPNVEDKSDEIVTTRQTLTHETYKRTYNNVHHSPLKKKRCVMILKLNTPVPKSVENTPLGVGSSRVQTDTEQSSAAHSAQHRVTDLHRPPDPTTPLSHDIQQTAKPKQFLLQTVKQDDTALLDLKKRKIVKLQMPNKT